MTRPGSISGRKPPPVVELGQPQPATAARPRFLTCSDILRTVGLMIADCSAAHWHSSCIFQRGGFREQHGFPRPFLHQDENLIQVRSQTLQLKVRYRARREGEVMSIFGQVRSLIAFAAFTVFALAPNAAFGQRGGHGGGGGGLPRRRWRRIPRRWGRRRFHGGGGGGFHGGGSGGGFHSGGRRIPRRWLFPRQWRVFEWWRISRRLLRGHALLRWRYPIFWRW